MTNFMNAFLKDEDGAVTVDWVVLTAAIVGLGVAAISQVSGGITDLGEDVATALDDGTRVGAGIPADEE